MIYGYARCSTNESKQDINRQRNELKKLGATEDSIYFEYASGAKVDRVQLKRLFDTVNTGDTIVTTEVSRITRSTKQLCDVIELVKNKGLKLVIGNSMTIDCTNGELDAMTKAFLQMAGVFAELERDMTVARIKSGMANAKAKGVHIGRKSITAEDIPNNFKRYYRKYKNKEMNISELSRLCQISRTTVYKYINLLESN